MDTLSNEIKDDEILTSNYENTYAPISRRIIGSSVPIGDVTAKFNIAGQTQTINDSVNLQGAIDELYAAGGGTLYLKPGIYIPSSDINLYPNVAVIGQSSGATIIDFNNTAYKIVAAGTGVYSAGTITSITGGVVVTGSGTSWLANVTPLASQLFIGGRWHLIAAVTSDTTLILAEGYAGTSITPGAAYRIATPINNISLKNLAVKNSTATQFDVDYTRNVILENVLFQDGLNGFSLAYVSDLAATQVICVSQSGDGYQLNNVGFGFMQNVSAVSNGLYGARIFGCKTIPFSYCSCVDNALNGYNIDTCSDLQFIAEASGNGVNGFELTQNNDNITIDGLVYGNVKDGVKLTATSDNCRIKGKITGNGNATDMASSSLGSDASLVSSWKLNGTVSDEKGTNNGTANALTYGSGKFDQAGVFNGSTSRVAIADSASLDITGNFSVSLWIKKAANGVTGGLFSKGGPYQAGDSGFETYFYTDNKIYFDAKLGGVDRQLASLSTITDNNWHFIVITYNGSTMSIYIDGALDNSVNYSGAVATNNLSAGIGARNNGTGASDSWGNSFNGSIDDVTIFNRNLTLAEISTYYTVNGYGINIAASTCDNNIIDAPILSTNASGNIYDTGTGTIKTITSYATTQVFSGTAPTAYTDLNLSSVVGAGQKTVILRITQSSGGDIVYNFRRNGEATALSNPVTRGTGLGGASVQTATIAYVLAVTDTAGIVEWINLTGGSITTTINVESYW